MIVVAKVATARRNSNCNCVSISDAVRIDIKFENKQIDSFFLSFFFALLFSLSLTLLFVYLYLPHIFIQFFSFILFILICVRKSKHL